MTAIRPVTIVTGASSGIGAELARVFARNGHGWCWWRAARTGSTASGRRDRWSRSRRARWCWRSILDSPMPATGSMKPLPRTISNLNSWSIMPASGWSARSNRADRSEQLAMIDLNIRTLTDFSLRWVEPMTRHRGGLLNVASVAGFLPGPGSAVYYASKAFVVSFTEALHQEWKSRGVADHRLVSRPGADRIPGARRRREWREPAAAGSLGRSCRGGGLSRADGRAAAGGARRFQQAHRQPVAAIMPRKLSARRRSSAISADG